jgi:hypothetical protein
MRCAYVETGCRVAQTACASRGSCRRSTKMLPRLLDSSTRRPAAPKRSPATSGAMPPTRERPRGCAVVAITVQEMKEGPLGSGISCCSQATVSLVLKVHGVQASTPALVRNVPRSARFYCAAIMIYSVPRNAVGVSPNRLRNSRLK